jgi:tetratricopeptide (TPR) repeat protein
MALSYAELGTTARLRGRLDETDDWYRRVLAIHEEIGNRLGMADAYQELGITAQLRGQLEEADDWYRKSLAIKEILGGQPRLARTYGQLGLLAEERQQLGQALDWTVQCVALFEQFPHPATEPGPRHLARLARQLGMPALDQAWRQVTGQSVPHVVREYIASHRDEPL